MVKPGGMMPFFCYFGGKWRVGKSYPKPKFDRIIEPFAGAAGYATRYPNLDVSLYDVDQTICGVWDYLIRSDASEIGRLPLVFDHVQDLTVCQEAKWLIGFWLNKGASTPRLQPSAWMRSGIRPKSYWGEAIRDRIASQVSGIKHWKIRNGSFESCEDCTATWFVDPPYVGDAGKNYRCRFEDYDRLAGWCRTRKGRVIVCEMSGAEWLPFVDFRRIKSTPGATRDGHCREVIWTNEPIPQKLLF